MPTQPSSACEMRIELFQDHERRIIVGSPESGDNVLGSGQQKRSCECRNPLLAFDRANRSVTGGENNEIGL